MAKMAKKVNYRDPTHIVEADDVDESNSKGVRKAGTANFTRNK